MVTDLKLAVLISLVSATTVGCSVTDSSSSSSTTPTTAEESYCSTVTPVTNGVAVSGQANFKRWVDGSAGLTTTEVLPIEYAEVAVYNAAGSIIQCAETDATGAFSFNIDKTAGTYTVKVNSRANNSYLKASILNNPTSNQYYSISTSFSIAASDTTKAVGTILALHNGSLQGGAFNILHDIYLANKYIRTQTASGTCTGTFCSNSGFAFTVAPKLSVFWTPGETPGKYFSQPSSGVSFFYRSSGGSLPTGLYILGGLGGSVCQDTDHFDNSVILHEYGHFLEYTYAHSDSPGGTHNGDAVIDPRLAWSEGWANFIQGAIQSRNVYRDTKSNKDCGGSYGLSFSDFSLTTPSALQDTTTTAGEGVYREMSVARSLYKSITAVTNVAFSHVWYAFSDSTNGLKNSNEYFRDSGLFFKKLYNNAIAAGDQSGLATMLNAENQYYSATQYLSRFYYGDKLASSGSACTGGNLSFSNSGSDKVQNYTESASGIPTSFFFQNANRYFTYYYDGTAAGAVIQLDYSSTGTSFDLDLYVYVDQYDLFTDSDIAKKSKTLKANESPAGREQISLSGLSAGYYMVNVRATASASAAATNFTLKNGSGAYLCPQ